MRIGFIGLGNMGLNMARNLLRAGHHVTVYNRTSDKAKTLESEGAIRVDTAGAASKGEIVATMLADDNALEQVVFDDRGILANLPQGAIHAGLSTISTAMARRLSEAHHKAGQRYVSSPVFGRPQAAEAAKLVVVAAGAPDALEDCKPLFDAVGRQTFLVGDHPFHANVMKLSGNFMIMSLIEMIGEAFVLCRKSGVSPELFLEAIGSVINSPVLSNYGKIVLEERFDPAGFKLRLGLKDATLVLAAGAEVAAPLPLASLVRDHFLGGVGRGYGELDWAALSKVIAEDAGL